MISRQKRHVVKNRFSLMALRMTGNMKVFLLLAVATIMILYGVHYNSVEIYNSELARQNSPLKNWTDCMMENAEPFNGNYEEAWKHGWQKITDKCEKESLPRLNVSAFHNSDETKYHILPRQKWKSTVVTLGIGRDTAAENGLRQAIGKENIEFFGADPIYAENEELYSKIGKYFPFAVSATAGYSSASVLLNGTYVDKSVVNVDLVYFLTKIVNRTFFDAIWMDAEHAEYGLFPTMLKGGGLDQNGVVVCQWNMEIHSPDAAKKNLTYHFLLQTVRDARYAFFKLFQVGHLRLYFLNFEDKRCLEKYLP